MNEAIPPPLPPVPPGGYYYLPPVQRDPRAVDAGHLRLLAIFHFVYAGLGLVGLGFLAVHYKIMTTVFSNEKLWQNGQNAQPMPFRPDQFIGMFKWFYLSAGALIVVGMVLSALSGWSISQRRARMFSLVVAGLNCLRLPFGTVLGVFTLMILTRPSVEQAYKERA